ncbi:hypothetical protein A3B63_02890 [Candidatus Saccharibacteria bacterium RIFCSPLOWO2_01_FULL_49_22]|nr:MAG: hypothetical protein A3B63_02890 [Candidatus Saccharibacteria bacterium RIFCSPLOWO2_01_FULL_49_22]
MDLGEKVQRPNAIAQAMIWLFAGCNSPQYRQTIWRGVSEVVDEEDWPVHLPVGEADPEASPLTMIMPRLKKEVVVVGSGRTALLDIKKETQGQLAAAMTYKGQSRVGVLPSGETDLGYLESTDQSIIAMRAGRNDWGVGLGVYIPGQKKLVVSHSISIVEQNVPIADLAERYPDTTIF